MAATNRKQDSFIAQLQSNPEKFEFFQAVRMLCRAAKEVESSSLQGSNKEDNFPSSLSDICFKTVPSLNFPKSSICSVVAELDDKKKNSKFDVHVSFLGLAGINGALPDHYTELLLEQIRQHNYALRDFFDIFNHRSITLFYRAWEKYHFPFIVTNPIEQNTKHFVHFIESLYGNGTSSLRERLQVPEKVLSYYSGHFSKKIRSAFDLELILNDYFGITVKVLQFQKEYIYVEEQDLTRLGNEHNGRYNQLGISLLVGKKIISISNSFRILIGPLSFDQFQSFLPSQLPLLQLCDLVKFYAGPQYTFDLQLILKKEEVPFCEISSSLPARLGWETWIGTSIPFTNPQNTVFKYDIEKKYNT